MKDKEMGAIGLEMKLQNWVRALVQRRRKPLLCLCAPHVHLSQLRADGDCTLDWVDSETACIKRQTAQEKRRER